jgi:hypothetical protein
MNFAEIRTQVIEITKRPDLTTQINSAITSATLKAHQSNYYYKDLVEVAVEFGTSQHIQNFLPTDVLPRFRKAKYIRQWFGDATTGNFGNFFEPIQIENSLDGYGYTRNDVFYMAGQLLQVRGCTTVDRILFGAYQHPQATETGYDSWIAAELPYAIVYEAARIIFLSIGMQEQVAGMTQLVQEIYRDLTIGYVDDTPLT